MAPKTKKQKKVKKTETESRIYLVDYVSVSTTTGTQSSDTDSRPITDYDTTAHCSVSHKTVSQLSSTATPNQQQQHQQQQTTVKLAIYSEAMLNEEPMRTDDLGEQYATLQTYCSHCKRAIDDMSQAINCGLCHNWYDCECVGVTQRLLRAFQSDQRFKWLCKNCVANSGHNSFINII